MPQDIRQASFSVGATRWQTIRSVVLPAALPGILAGSLTGLCRAAGETAPIMFTAATFFTLQTPGSLSDQVMALPYHIYVLASSGTHIEETRPLQYGTVLVLICLVAGAQPCGYPHTLQIQKVPKSGSSAAPRSYRCKTSISFMGISAPWPRLTWKSPKASVTSIIGPKGCGKSTFLRLLNRMNDLIIGTRVEGKVMIHGVDLYGDGG